MNEFQQHLTTLVRCDEDAASMARRIDEWAGGAGAQLDALGASLPDLQRVLREGERTLRESRTALANDHQTVGTGDAGKDLVESLTALVDAHQKDQESLSTFLGFFQVVGDVQDALGSLAEVMDDVECFSVNAIVQAHNAGDRGRGFSQVSREVVGLTKRATEEFAQVRNVASLIEENRAQLEKNTLAFQQRWDEVADDVNRPDTLFDALDNTRTQVLGQLDRFVDTVGSSCRELTGLMTGSCLDSPCPQVMRQVQEAQSRFKQQLAPMMADDAELDEQDGYAHLLTGVQSGMHFFSLTGSLVSGANDRIGGSCEQIMEALEQVTGALVTSLEGLGDGDEMPQAVALCRNQLDDLKERIGGMVDTKGEIVAQVNELSDQIRDLKDDLEGVRRTAKRFGVMASIIKVELASVGLNEEFGEALSADRVENLYRDMASAVGSVLIALESTMKQIQRHSTLFQRSLIHQQNGLRDVDAHAKRLFRELQERLITPLRQGHNAAAGLVARSQTESTEVRRQSRNHAHQNTLWGHILDDAKAREQLLDGCLKQLQALLPDTEPELVAS